MVGCLPGVTLKYSRLVRCTARLGDRSPRNGEVAIGSQRATTIRAPEVALMERNGIGSGIRIDHRRIVIGALSHFQVTEAHERWSSASSRQFVDDLLITAGAIADGLQRDLTPDQVVADPGVRSAIVRHAHLVRSEGLSMARLVDQYHLLRQDMLRSLEVQSKQVKITGTDAFTIAHRLCALFDRVISMAMDAY